MEIKVLRDVQEANDAIAGEVRRQLKGKGIYTLNLVASPGAGKTTLLERTLDALSGEFRMAVIEGDIAGSADAERIGRHGVPVVQINTMGNCHLNAGSVRSALDHLPLDEIDLLFIENVGNLVCPAGFDIGEDAKVVVLSVAEGDDKPSKYPLIFAESSVMVLNKTDFLPLVEFDLVKARADARATHPDLAIYELSARTGEGMEGWLDWVRAQVTRR